MERILRKQKNKLKTSVRSKSETFDLLEKIKKKWPEKIIPKIKSFRVYEIDQDEFILKSENFIAVQPNHDIIVPFLGAHELLQHFPSVDIDMGAVKFVCNGAKVMRPGIVRFGIFKRGDIVIVKDQIHSKALAVGVALEDSEIALTRTRGYIIDNLHYISDKFWESYKEVSL